MSKIFERLVEARNLNQEFLAPDYEECVDPFTLSDMERAIDRIRQAVTDNEKILIYGDYDADGVTASTVMEQTLILIGVKPDHIDIMLPDRFVDGYGMSPRLIERAKKQGISLVVTVDCGSRNHAIIEELNIIGIDTIITDHHETTDEMPPAVAIINPHRRDAPSVEFYNLAGVGVAFKLAQAFVKKGMIPNGQEKWLLDLVLIGTICDSMLLTGENRILGYFGLKVLSKTRRPGLVALMQRAGIKNLNAESIGFQIGPRLNAAGRLETAESALNLLRAKTSIEAAPLVEKLEQLNKKRKTEQKSALQAIKERGLGDEPVIIETGKWHEGIIGIVAGRLMEEYHRPAFVLTETIGGIYKGSGRSFGDFNLANAISFAKDSIIGGGGHAAAAGVKVDSKKLYQFREQINEYYHSLNLTNQERFFTERADLEIDDFSELNLCLLQELSRLEPYGPGNEEPIFRLKNTKIARIDLLGAERNHLRIDLRDSSGHTLKCLAFFAPEDWLSLDPDYDHIEPLVKFIENDFNGIKSLEARIVDICRVETKQG